MDKKVILFKVKTKLKKCEIKIREHLNSLKISVSDYLVLGIVGLVLYFISYSSFFASVIGLIVSNIIFSYFTYLDIISKKWIAKRNADKEDKEFNEEYFDIFWNYHYKQLSVSFDIIIFIMSLAGRLIRSTKILDKVAIVLFGFILGFMLAYGVSVLGKKNRIIIELTRQKRTNYVPYTEEEVNILDTLE